MNHKKTAWLAWTLFGIVVVGASLGLVFALNSHDTQKDALVIGNDVLNAAFTIVFGIVGALIVGRHARNTIGWLLMAIALSLSITGLFENYLAQGVPTTPGSTLPTLVYYWLSGWTWWLLIGPLLLILLLFPTGRLLSPRWRWVIVALTGAFVVFLFFATFSKTLNDPTSGQSLPNPIGVLPESIAFELITAPMVIAMLILVAFCVVSVFVRYRRAGIVEREQLKWFLYACAVFLLIFAVGSLDASSNGFGVLLSTAILFLPVSIGIAILRYRLFDIDIIIRRTLIYTVLTAILALVYLGSVVLLQQLFRVLTGQSSEIAIIISTLAIAALFVPLRRRVQGVIDQRFYRRKYDAAKVLAAFGAAARDEVELDELRRELVSVVSETMQPEHVGLWLMPSPEGGRRPGAGK
jgi:hypothetical protein